MVSTSKNTELKAQIKVYMYSAFFIAMLKTPAMDVPVDACFLSNKASTKRHPIP
jgi:hypothetical protein